MPTWLKILVVVLVIACGVFLLDRLCLWMEARGWIYWRKVKPQGGMSPVLTAMQEFVQPEIRHVIEEREEHRAANPVEAAQADGESTG